MRFVYYILITYKLYNFIIMHIYRRKSTKREIKHNCFLYSYKYINYIIYLIIGVV